MSELPEGWKFYDDELFSPDMDGFSIQDGEMSWYGGIGEIPLPALFELLRKNGYRIERK